MAKVKEKTTLSTEQENLALRTTIENLRMGLLYANVVLRTVAKILPKEYQPPVLDAIKRIRKTVKGD